MTDATLVIDGAAFEVEVLRLQPGDTLVLRIHTDVIPAQLDEWRAILKAKFPGHEVIILGGGASLSVARVEAAA